MKSSQIVNDFARHQRAMGQADSTIEWYESLTRRFFLFLRKLKVRQLDEIDCALIMNYQAHIAEQLNKKGRPYSIPVQNLHIRVLRVLFGYLANRGEMARNPAADVRLAKEPDTLPRTVLSTGEVARVLETSGADTPIALRNRAMLEVLYSSGIRRAELLNLNMEDLNEDDLTLMIRKGKGGHDRVALLTRGTMNWLQHYIRDARPSLLGEKSGRAIFLSQKGGARLGKMGLLYVVNKLSTAAGIEKAVTPHVFRHSIATHLLNNGAGLPHVQRFLGHKKIGTTVRYTHLALGDLRPYWGRVSRFKKRLTVRVVFENLPAWLDHSA